MSDVPRKGNEFLPGLNVPHLDFASTRAGQALTGAGQTLTVRAEGNATKPASLSLQRVQFPSCLRVPNFDLPSARRGQTIAVGAENHGVKRTLPASAGRRDATR